jgi:hypothetical protein
MAKHAPDRWLTYCGFEFSGRLVDYFKNCKGKPVGYWLVPSNGKEDATPLHPARCREHYEEFKGQLMVDGYRFVAIQGATVGPRKCDCAMTILLRNGCKCGGV